MYTVRSLLTEAAAGESRRDAEILLGHALGRDRAWLTAHDSDPLPADGVSRFRALWARRLAGEPVAYLTGRRGFWSLDLAVTPAVLIPRPETELLVERALAGIPADAAWEIADLGTGSGAIALALARERPQCRVTATDHSGEALAVARANARDHDIGNLRLVHGEWWAPLQGEHFHVAVSNPPYVAAADPHLRQGDLRFEPPGALASGADGLDDLRAIIAGAPDHLHPGGALLVEHGFEQAEAVRGLFRDAGFRHVCSWLDLAGHERVTGGELE